MPSEDADALRTIVRSFPALAPGLQSLLDQRPGLQTCEPFIRMLAALLAKYPKTIGGAAIAQAKDSDLRQTFVYLKNSTEHHDLWLWLMDFKQRMHALCESDPPSLDPKDYAHAWLFISRCAYRVMEHGRGSASASRKTRSRAAR